MHLEIIKKSVRTGDDGKPVDPIKADALKPVVQEYLDAGNPFNMGMVFPASTHNHELRFRLAAGGIHPGFYAPLCSKTEDTSWIE